MTRRHAAIIWIVLALAAIPVSLFAPGIWTSGSLLFLVLATAFDLIVGYPKLKA